MNPNAAAYIRLIKHPLKFRLFLLSQLPSAFFSGVRVRDISERHCVATVPYKWFSKNPFRSTYFACLAMAAEMTTGMLGQLAIYKRKPSVSMLVVNVYGEYFKKAVGRTSFACEDGELFNKTIEEAIATGEARTVKAKSVGKNEAGEIVAEFYVTWSFKRRNK
jgi:hypothetical protein